MVSKLSPRDMQGGGQIAHKSSTEKLPFDMLGRTVCSSKIGIRDQVNMHAFQRGCTHTASADAAHIATFCTGSSSAEHSPGVLSMLLHTSIH